MLELQLPHPMPHAIPRDRPFTFYAPGPQPSKMDATMQLPYPTMANTYQHDPLRTASRAPLTPPDLPGSAVRVVSLPSNQGSGNQYGYQLPAIGNSRSAAAPRSPSPQRQQPQAQETAQTPKKKWSISPNLRIPPTINTPQEGLPQLAAEVSNGTILFSSGRAYHSNFIGYLSFLVREFGNSQTSRRHHLSSSAHAASRPGRTPYNRL
jgi:hypothetical protein